MSKKPKVDALVVWKLDRLSRKADEGLMIRTDITRKGGRLISITEPSGEDATSRMIQTVMLGFAEWDNDMRSERCKRGMKDVIERGGWCHKAPHGYKIARGDRNLAILVPDGEKSEGITKILKSIASGARSVWDAVADLKREGFSKTTAHAIIRNPVYGGIVRSHGRDIIAAFQGMVTPAEWYKIETLVDRVEMKYVRVKVKDDFWMTGAVMCPECESPLAGSYSRGKSGRKFGYYACKRGHVRVGMDGLHAYVRGMVGKTPELIAAFGDALRGAVEIIIAESRNKTENESNIRKKITLLEAKAEDVASKWAVGKIDDETRLKLFSAIKAERAKCEMRLAEISESATLMRLCDRISASFEKIEDVWDTSDAATKKKLFSVVFGCVTLQKVRQSFQLVRFSRKSSKMSNPQNSAENKDEMPSISSIVQDGGASRTIVELAKRFVELVKNGA